MSGTETGWGFVRSPRWLRFVGLAVLFAVACGLLSWWQLSRRNEALQEIARVTANYDTARAGEPSIPDRSAPAVRGESVQGESARGESGQAREMSSA